MNNPENVQAPKVIATCKLFIGVLMMNDDISLNLTLFERHAELTFLPKKDWRAHAEGIVIIYMDDLVIPAKDEKEGLEKLRKY
ncbi:hypothetical protein TNCV_400141 [Trichonephila clavipes]|nr:hypothetical protein TNCV_400141 [Trichonephila clavipes]